MKISTHVKNTYSKLGIEARDIHEWIDGLFDHKRFEKFCHTGALGDFNPYDHRRQRHCREAADDAVKEFIEKYPEEIIRIVFEDHVREDYFGFFPSRADYDDPNFHEKYHIY